MRLPKKLKILGREFDVHYFDFAKKLHTNNQNGGCCQNAQIIEIDSTLHHEAQASTLLHEVVHTVSSCLGLDFDEATVLRLEAGLFQVLNDNGLFAEEEPEDAPPIADLDDFLAKNKKEVISNCNNCKHAEFDFKRNGTVCGPIINVLGSEVVPPSEKILLKRAIWCEWYDKREENGEPPDLNNIKLEA